jgi:hypothetical protein
MLALEKILSHAKVTGEGAIDASTIKNLHFNFLIFFIFNLMAQVSQDGKVTGDNPFSYSHAPKF